MAIAIILLLVALYALCTAGAAAFLAANPLRLEVSIPREGLIARAAHELIAGAGALFLACQAGRLLGLIGLTTAAILWTLPGIHDVLHMSWGLPPVPALVVALTALVAVLAVLVLVVGEMIPRSIALRRPELTARYLAVPLRILQSLLLPITGLTQLVGIGIQKLTRDSVEPLTDILDRDIDSRVRSRIPATDGSVDRGEILFDNVLTMATVRVKDSMVPRTDIFGVEEGTPISDVLAQFVESGYSKLPVFRENLDRIVGLAFAHDLFSTPASLEDIIRPARFVPESKASKDLLREFLAGNSSIAIVIDEYGGTAGLVTREDLLEELFGDIEDEFDWDDDVLEQDSDGSILASGRVSLETLEDRCHIALPEGDYESVGGYLLERLGAIPETGHECRFDGCTFAIVKATTSRIELVRLVPDHPPAP
jgi:putative hemolysin